jgi:hypothetical protein
MEEFEKATRLCEIELKILIHAGAVFSINMLSPQELMLNPALLDYCAKHGIEREMR